jgi:hypothetical protein
MLGKCCTTEPHPQSTEHGCYWILVFTSSHGTAWFKGMDGNWTLPIDKTKGMSAQCAGTDGCSFLKLPAMEVVSECLQIRCLQIRTFRGGRVFLKPPAPAPGHTPKQLIPTSGADHRHFFLFQTTQVSSMCLQVWEHLLCHNLWEKKLRKAEGSH